MFNVISLFAGCGGSSLGYRMAGCKVVAAVERDTHAASVYKANFPGTRLWSDDITGLAPERVLDELQLQKGELDILDGSPPCQGFSMAGKRRVEDPRNRLFEQYVCYVNATQPRAFVMENVPGLVAGTMKNTFLEMIRLLEEAGYTVGARILNAAHYGVPQNRRRVIVIGIRKDLGLIPVHPAPVSLPVSFRQAVTGLENHELILLPRGRALKMAQAIRSGECGADVHQRYGHKRNEFSLIRLSWDKPCPTVLKTIRPGQVGLLHPSEDRFLSIGKLKRVCAFPDDFVLSGSFEERWARLGNAVPPLLTKAVAAHLVSRLEGTK